MIKIYGYPLNNSYESNEMKEISLQTTPQKLKEIAEFLMRSANKIADGGKDASDHFHFRDYVAKWDENFPDIVVINTNLNQP